MKTRLFQPRPAFPGQFYLRFARQRLEFIEDLAASGHQISFFRLGYQRFFFVNDPELIKDVLVSNHQVFEGGVAGERLKVLLGDGLVTATGEAHQRQRRIVQAVFQHRHLPNYVEIIVNQALKLLSRWRDGSPLNIREEMRTVTMMITGESLFGADVESETLQIRTLIDQIVESSSYLDYGLLGCFYRLVRHPKAKQLIKARDGLNEILHRIIAPRRGLPGGQADLLSALLLAQDSETGIRMSEIQLRDEVITHFLTSHEASATALTWTLFLLARHPEIQSELRQELQTVLGRDQPTMGHLEKLKLLDQVVRESLRLYPPVYLIARRATNNHQLAGIGIPRGAIVFLGIWSVQRSAKYYSDPLEFRPERWTSQFKSSLPRYAFYPFGGGPRQCIGEGFARLQLLIVVGILLREWRVELVPGQTIKPKAGISLRAIIHKA
jgi:cytochrome P450